LLLSLKWRRNLLVNEIVVTERQIAGVTFDRYHIVSTSFYIHSKLLAPLYP